MSRLDRRDRSPGARRGRRVAFAAALLTPLALCGCVTMIFEGSLIYFPTRYPDGEWSPEDRPQGEGDVVCQVEDVALEASDGVALHAWWATPARLEGDALVPLPADELPVLLWLHGNAGNLSYRWDMLRRLVARLPARVLILDYRGYGKSEGGPSEEGLYRDARAAWDHLVTARGLEPGDVVVLGKSLGGGPASELATQVAPGGLILQSTFTSIPDMAGEVFPLVPGFLIRHDMNNLAKVARVGCPVLVVHSPADEVIPYAMGRRLFEAAPEPKRFHEVPGAGHNDTYLVGGEAYLDALRDFLALCAERERAAD